MGRTPQEWDKLPNKNMQQTALCATADAERYAACATISLLIREPATLTVHSA